MKVNKEVYFADNKQKKHTQSVLKPLKYALILVGMAGFEPTTSSTPCWRDTGLRYIPKLLAVSAIKLLIPI
jgi:hypothetical protein